MNIYESIAAVQADVDFIGKDKQTQQGEKYKYRGVDQVLNTLHPVFAKHKMFAVPEVLDILNREERTTKNGGKVLYQVLKVKYTFYAEDGTSVSAVVVGEAMDSGDKVSNKCMSVAYKYACFQILSIPTEETCADPDDNADSFKDNSDKKPAKPAEKPKTQPKSTAPREEVPFDEVEGELTRTQIIEGILSGTDYDMSAVKDYIVCKFHKEIPINDLTEAQFNHVVAVIEKNINA